MTIATWNINSVRLRIDNLARLIAEASPDVIALQEIKCPDEAYPRAAIAALGYPHQYARGMKGYNGVAILSRLPFTATHGLDWCERQDCRHAAVKLAGGIELHNFYVPAGGDRPDPAANDKFAHKLRFLEELAAWSKAERAPRQRRILVGDLNVAPLPNDVWSHKALLDVVCHTPGEVDRLNALQEAESWVDALREFYPPEQKLFTWWSYRAQDWRASDRGRRLDHIWVTPALRGQLRAARVCKDARDWRQPSDHVPVVVTLEV
ncbi:MAG: exodeoxyribonuclease III [Alphaproteobacteria bacterium]|nr:exodeoxyribonuclease III [Alphaproteobacteria bacterium]